MQYVRIWDDPDILPMLHHTQSMLPLGFNYSLSKGNLYAVLNTTVLDNGKIQVNQGFGLRIPMHCRGRYTCVRTTYLRNG